MRVHEPGQDYLSGAIELDNFLAVLSDPWVAQRVFGFAGRDDLLPYRQNRAILNDAKFLKIMAAAWAGDSGRRAQRQQLADVDQQERAIGRCFVFRRTGHWVISLAVTV